ncbi:unnamed protein product [Prorocentrum cordatum]|uniref:Uncharacterized protein n=1 Tax=Prorocentrum cordatum TaxID=2364126 RepID=A0ABN9V633_9DINO|nr:unnamed protein product [Polarella glacialis]
MSSTSVSSSTTVTSSTSLSTTSGSSSTTVSSTTSTGSSTTAHSTTATSSTTLTLTTTTGSSTTVTTSSATSTTSATASSSTTGSSTTVTPRRFSHVTATVGLALPAAVDAAQAKSIAQSSVSSFLGVAESLVSIDSVTTARRLTQRGGVAVQRRLNSVVYDIEYRVEVEGTDTSAVSAALDSLTNDTSPLAAVVQQTMNDQSVSGAFLVEYVGEPVEELWMYTTATMTSTISVTSTSGTMSESSSTSSSTTTRKICYADSIPYMPNVADSSSCVGIFSGTSCSPVCISGYELVAPITCTDTSNSSDTFGEFEFNPVVCVPEAHVEALDSADVLLVEAALIESEANSNLSADWAAGAEVQAAIISAFSTALELYEGQVYIASIADLNSDSESGIPASRRMTTAQGLWMRVLIQLYPTNSETDLRASLANLDTICRELTAALQNFGIGVPPGLATASLVVGVPASSTAIAPVARWVARTQWSLCSNVCGEGQRIRTVECLTNSTGLCNSNAPPDYTMESFMPETIVCQQYTECPYDWTCPSGKEPVTGGGCEVQASLVICAMVVSFFIVSCCLIRYVRRLNASKAPTKEQSTTRLDPMSDKGADIEWTREEGIVDKKGKHKATGCATLTLQCRTARATLTPRRTARASGSGLERRSGL